jgi:hypothetical protein
MDNTEKFTSNRASVETRHNAKQNRYRVHIAAGKRRIGPIFVRLPHGEGTAADAARVALERAVKRREIEFGMLEHDDGEIVVHPELHRTRGKFKAAKARLPIHEPNVSAAARTRRAATLDPKAEKDRARSEPAMPVLPNGELTRELETQYRSAKKQYHVLGDALRERHEAVAVIEAER